jgi:hypothetical protein
MANILFFIKRGGYNWYEGYGKKYQLHQINYRVKNGKLGAQRREGEFPLPLSSLLEVF